MDYDKKIIEDKVRKEHWEKILKENISKGVCYCANLLQISHTSVNRLCKKFNIKRPTRKSAQSK